MKQEDLERQWKQQRAKMDVDPTFCESVMHQVRDAARRGKVDKRRWEDWIGIRPAVQMVLYAAAGIIGLARLVWMIHSILFQGVCYSC